MLVGSTGCTDIHANNKKYEKKEKKKKYTGILPDNKK
jgi:hypothetical protein